MSIGIVLVHDDHGFVDLLTAALKNAGYTVDAFDDPAFVVPPPRVMDRLELTITRAAAPHTGLRIRVTGLPAGEPYAGALGQFIAEPATVPDVVRVVARFIA